MFLDQGVYMSTLHLFLREGVPQDEVGLELVTRETVTEVVRVASYTVPSTYKVRLIPPPPTLCI
jgi:hypothetical protein